jgi:glyoxylase-like metal-dependent hydrolase (beta-lactamase superfamily II)
VKTKSSALLAGFLVLCATVKPALADIAGFARQTTQVTPRVHLIARRITTGAPNAGNSIVIEQSDGLVVVDAGGSPAAGRHIVREIRKLSAKPVKYLIYTHYHGDHNLGAGAFLRAWPHLAIVSTDVTRDEVSGTPMEYIKAHAQDYAGEIAFAREQLKRADLLPDVRAGWQQLVGAGQSIVDGYKNMKADLATLTFSDRLTIPDSQTPIEVMFLGRDDADGNAVVWARTEKVLYTGDIVIGTPPYAAASYAASWIAVLDRIGAYDFAYLIQGHGQVQKDRAYFHETKGALAKIQDEVAGLAEKGAALADIHGPGDFKSLTLGIIQNAYSKAVG